MKKFIRFSLLTSILFVAFIVLGSTNVNATELTVWDETGKTPITDTVDFGELEYGESLKKTFIIKNPTTEGIYLTYDNSEL